MRISDDIRWIVTVFVFTGCAFLIGVLLGIKQDDVRVRIEEPEAYESVIQELEAIPEIQNFSIDRSRSAGWMNWRLYVNLRDDVSFHFEEVKNFSDLNDQVDRIKQYLKLTN